MSVWQLVGLGFLTFLLGLLNSCLAIAALASTPDARGQYAHLMADPLWLEPDGQHVAFLAVERVSICLYVCTRGRPLWMTDRWLAKTDLFTRRD